MTTDPYTDPRNEPIEISKDDLSDDAIDGLIDSYCSQFHGLNDQEDPAENRAVVRKALFDGKLGIYFDPAEEVAALHHKGKW